MIEVYALNSTVAAGDAVSWNNVQIRKGCTAVLSAPATINLNERGVYAVTCGASAAANVSIELYKDGVAVPQTLRTGLTPEFTTLVQVSSDNTCQCCTSPTVLQIRNVGNAVATFGAINLVVTKVC